MSEITSTPGALVQLVRRAKQLYTLPTVAMEVLELTNNPQVDAACLKACIEKDPALTTKVLRVVNSSLFGLSREVSDLNQAVTLLGIKPLKLLVLGFSLPKELFAGPEADILARYWRQTLTKAVAAREISETIWRQPGDEAFIAGLLQDLGMLALLQDLGEPYARFLEKVFGKNGDLAALELATLGFDHTILSARLLDHWGLPESLVAAVATPQEMEPLASLPAEERDLPQILHLASLLAELLTADRPDVLSELLVAGRRYRDLSEAQLSELVGVLQEKVEQLAEVLSLRCDNCADYVDLLARAYEQLADLAGSVAGPLAMQQDETEALWHETQSLSRAVADFTGQNRSESPGPPPAPSAPPAGQDTTARGAQPTALVQPVTARCGLVDPALIGRLTAAVASCRHQRCSLSLLLVEIDNYEELMLTCGLEPAAEAVHLLGAATGVMGQRETDCMKTGDARFALILENCDREQAVRAGRRLLLAMRRWAGEWDDIGMANMTVSVGVATVTMPAKNFPSKDLVEAAERCLSAARTFAGDGVKSIGIY